MREFQKLPRSSSLNLLRRITVRGAVALVGLTLLIATSSRAQGAPRRDSRWAVGASLEGGSAPNAFYGRCGSGQSGDDAPVYGGGLSVIRRPKRGLVFIAE